MSPLFILVILALVFTILSCFPIRFPYFLHLAVILICIALLIGGRSL